MQTATMRQSFRGLHKFSGQRPVIPSTPEGSKKDFSRRFTLRGCEKIRSWFDMLTTSGVPQWEFKYLARVIHCLME
jgi:hypothetical protein